MEDLEIMNGTPLIASPAPVLARARVFGSFGGVYHGRRVLVTGHTGFKGAWLSHWLLSLGADVTGYALAPATSPTLFSQLGLERRMRHLLGDVRDLAALCNVVGEGRFDFIFHLAAQPLVRLSYAEPITTYASNIMGTAHVLEAVRTAGCRCVVLAITTDKCYENREWIHSYREEDPLGGHDPYSSSKAAAEIVIAGYRQSYFSNAESNVRVASARAGNVIAGGDWAFDRIVPDCVRALRNGEAIPVRNRRATRPWQHVLEPLSGYLWLAACLDQPVLLLESGTFTRSRAALESRLSSAFNFGPNLSSNRSVGELVQEILRHWPGTWDDRTDPTAVHEANLLNLAIDKARHLLRWHPIWDFSTTVGYCMQWYLASSHSGRAAAELCDEQIARYVADARAQSAVWATGGGT